MAVARREPFRRRKDVALDAPAAPPVGDGTRVIDAVYHFNGSEHAFTAQMHVVATGHAAGDTAVLTGRVTAGWLKGNLVSAEYTQGTCTHGGVTTTCFQGSLAILRGTKSGG